jgi:hypothetical protein
MKSPRIESESTSQPQNVYNHSLAADRQFGSWHSAPRAFEAKSSAPAAGLRVHMGRTIHTSAQAPRWGVAGAAVGVVIAALFGLSAGCGLVIGLGDRELFPSEGGAPEGGEASAAHDAGEAGVAASECPFTECSGGACCYPADNSPTLRTACQGGCGVGQFSVACGGPAECGGGTCCATVQGALARRTPTPPAPACAGWSFRGSACGGCASQVPTACGVNFAALMCEKSADCPSSNSQCCHVGSGDIFAYCMDSATRASVDPFQCLQ